MKKENIFLDDIRGNEKELATFGYTVARSYMRCITLLSAFKEIGIISLDYALNSQYTGLDVLCYMHENNIQVDKIIIHSGHEKGVLLMENYIQEYFPDILYDYLPYDKKY